RGQRAGRKRTREGTESAVGLAERTVRVREPGGFAEVVMSVRLREGLKRRAADVDGSIFLCNQSLRSVGVRFGDQGVAAHAGHVVVALCLPELSERACRSAGRRIAEEELLEQPAAALV